VSDLLLINSKKTELKGTLFIIFDGYRWMSAQDPAIDSPLIQPQ